MNPIDASWPLDGPLELIANTGQSRVGGADPTSFVRDGRVWRASRFSSGPSTVSIWIDGPMLRAQAWGPGAEAALAGVPDLTGMNDDSSGFEPSLHPVVHEVARARPGIRLGATRALFDAAVPTILGQKVTGIQAKRSYYALVRRCNDRAPLAVVSRRPLFLPPSPSQVLEALAGHGATALGIDITRTAALREVANVADRVEGFGALPPAQARAALTRIPGVGEWTANWVSLIAMGDADAVQVGDFHLKNVVTFALTGRPRGTDEDMVKLLEQFRPHRARAMRFIGLSGVRPPKYGPRMSVPSHVPHARR